MKRLILIVAAIALLSTAAVAQLTYSNKRTDNAVYCNLSAPESNCPTGSSPVSGANALGFVGQSSDTVPFLNLTSTTQNAGVGEWMDTDFGTLEIFMTDNNASGQGCPVGNPQSSWAVGNGDIDAFSLDNHLAILSNTGANWCLFYIDTARIIANACPSTLSGGSPQAKSSPTTRRRLHFDELAFAASGGKSGLPHHQ